MQREEAARNMRVLKFPVGLRLEKVLEYCSNLTAVSACPYSQHWVRGSPGSIRTREGEADASQSRCR